MPVVHARPISVELEGKARQSELVEMFRTMRQFNLTLWKGMSPADLKRIGQHNERGPEPLGVMLRMLAGHDLSHLDQITRYIQAVRQRELCRRALRRSGATPPRPGRRA